MAETSALNDMVSLKPYPNVSAFLSGKKQAPTPKGYIGEPEIFPAQQELRQAQAKAREDIGKADINIEKAKREEQASKMQVDVDVEKESAERIKEMPERMALKAKQEESSALKFMPTKDTAQDIAGLFGLVGVISMALGGGGRMSGHLALGNMNAMMEGYRKGRTDLNKREAVEFDKNFKAMQAALETLSREYKDALEIEKSDKERGRLERHMALAKSNSPVLKAMEEKLGPVRVNDFLNELQTTMDKSVTLHNNLQKHADDLQDRKERAKQAADLRRDLATIKSDKTAVGKALTDKQSREVEGLDSLSKGLEQLKKDFKPEFASLGVLGFGADMEFEARRRLGDKKGQEAISWWSKYERLQAPNRHALFGATLTGKELKNYQSFTAKKSDSPETVKTFLDDQIAYSNSVGNNKKLVYEAAGYKVPEAKARDFIESFSTQPSKYSVGQEITQGNKKYRVVDISNPDDPEIEEIK